MTCLPYEHRLLDVPGEDLQEVIALLMEMGLSLRVWPDGSVTAIVRHGFRGALDRLAVIHAELRFTKNRLERRQWLEMCWRLPLCPHPL